MWLLCHKLKLWFRPSHQYGCHPFDIREFSPWQQFNEIQPWTIFPFYWFTELFLCKSSSLPKSVILGNPRDGLPLRTVGVCGSQPAFRNCWNNFVYMCIKIIHKIHTHTHNTHAHSSILFIPKQITDNIHTGLAHRGLICNYNTKEPTVFCLYQVHQRYWYNSCIVWNNIKLDIGQHHTNHFLIVIVIDTQTQTNVNHKNCNKTTAVILHHLHWKGFKDLIALTIFQGFNCSHCCSEVQVGSSTLWHHFWVWLHVWPHPITSVSDPGPKNNKSEAFKLIWIMLISLIFSSFRKRARYCRAEDTSSLVVVLWTSASQDFGPWSFKRIRLVYYAIFFLLQTNPVCRSKPTVCCVVLCLWFSPEAHWFLLKTGIFDCQRFHPGVSPSWSEGNGHQSHWASW